MKSCGCLCKNSDQVSHFHVEMCASCFSSAADWKLDEPAWSGRMKITAKDKMAYIKLEDKNTGKQTDISLKTNVVCP